MTRPFTQFRRPNFAGFLTESFTPASQVRILLFTPSATHYKHLRSWRRVLIARGNKSGSAVEMQSGSGFEIPVEIFLLREKQEKINIICDRQMKNLIAAVFYITNLLAKFR